MVSQFWDTLMGRTKKRMNQHSVTFWASQSALQTEINAGTEPVRIGSHVYLEDTATSYQVKTVSPLILTPLGGGGSVDYPNWSYKEARDHFERNAFELTNAIDRYITEGGSSTISYSAAQNEFYFHAITTGAVVTNSGDSASTSGFTVYHTKNDKDVSFTKAIVEFRVRTGVRVASLRLAVGLFDPTAVITGNPASVTSDKILFVIDGTGNWFGRVANGTTESTDDLVVSADNTTYKLRLEWTSSQVEFFVDGISQGVITTNLPDVPLKVVPMWVRNDTGVSDGANDLICDYWHFKME